MINEKKKNQMINDNLSFVNLTQISLLTYGKFSIFYTQNSEK